MKQESFFFCFPNLEHGMFSREFPFCLFYKLCIHMDAYRAKFKRNSSLGYYITWSEMEKQDIKAKLGLFGWFLLFYHHVVG